MTNTNTNGMHSGVQCSYLQHCEHLADCVVRPEVGVCVSVTDQCPIPCFLCFQQVCERVGCSDALLLVAGCKSAQQLLYGLWEAGQAPQGERLGGFWSAGCAAAETATIPYLLVYRHRQAVILLPTDVKRPLSH